MFEFPWSEIMSQGGLAAFAALALYLVRQGQQERIKDLQEAMEVKTSYFELMRSLQQESHAAIVAHTQVLTVLTEKIEQLPKMIATALHEPPGGRRD